MTPEHERSRGGNPGSEHSTSPTTTTVTPPTVTALAVTPRGRTRQVTVQCPHCGRRHHHGWPYGPEAEPGLRRSHCAPYRTTGGHRVEPEPGSYYIAAPSVGVAS